MPEVNVTVPDFILLAMIEGIEQAQDRVTFRIHEWLAAKQEFALDQGIVKVADDTLAELYSMDKQLKTAWDELQAVPDE